MVSSGRDQTIGIGVLLILLGPGLHLWSFYIKRLWPEGKQTNRWSLSRQQWLGAHWAMRLGWMATIIGIPVLLVGLVLL